MKKSYRHVLLLVSFVIFLATAPLVILYAIGYRSALNGTPTQAVGVAIIESEPSRASVYINNNYVGKTPKSITNLPVGSVTIRIEKDGYQSWQKQLLIHATMATETRTIRLIPLDPIIAKVASDISYYSLSPNRRLFAAADDTNNILIYDSLHQVVGSKTSYLGQLKSLLWSPASDAILITTNGINAPTVAYVAQARPPQTLTGLINARDIVWDPRLPGRILFIDQSDNLRALTADNQSSFIIASNIQSFATSSRHIYAIDNSGQVSRYSLLGSRDDVKFILPPDLLPTRLFVTPSGTIAAQLADSSIWLISTDAPSKIALSAQRIAWSPSGDMLLIQSDDTSLYVFNVSDQLYPLPLGQLNLVTRLSRPITNAEWFAGNGHLLYQVDDAIMLTEIDIRDHPLTYQIDTTNRGNALTSVGEDGAKIYYLKNNSGKTMLVETSLSL